MTKDGKYQFPLVVTNTGEATASRVVYEFGGIYVPKGATVNLEEKIESIQKIVEDGVVENKKTHDSAIEWPPMRPITITNPGATFTQEQVDAILSGGAAYVAIFELAYTDGQRSTPNKFYFAEFVVRHVDLMGRVEQFSYHNYGKHNAFYKAKNASPPSAVK
jgi:hypothetical protein